jgi:hypothetical protein
LGVAIEGDLKQAFENAKSAVDSYVENGNSKLAQLREALKQVNE